MENKTDLEKDLGYLYLPFRHGGSNGFRELIINIPEQPSHEHFDPVEVHVHAVVHPGVIEEHTLFHPYTAHAKMSLAPGKIIIQDRRGKREEAFNFGSRLTILNQPESTQCRIVSEAPILPDNRTGSVTADLVDEIEILLAERRAAWLGRGEEEFEKKLLSVNPLLLCAALLNEISSEFKDHQLQSLSTNRRLLAFVREEIHLLRENGRWPADVPPMEELI